jgi:hypothetical protein
MMGVRAINSLQNRVQLSDGGLLSFGQAFDVGLGVCCDNFNMDGHLEEQYCH